MSILNDYILLKKYAYTEHILFGHLKWPSEFKNNIPVIKFFGCICNMCACMLPLPIYMN